MKEIESFVRIQRGNGVLEIPIIRKISTCGDCLNWMKSECPRENDNFKKNPFYKPSCDEIICDKFKPAK